MEASQSSTQITPQIAFFFEGTTLLRERVYNVRVNSAVHVQSCTEFTAAGHPLSGAPRSETTRKNYFFGGPALRCGGDTTRGRFGKDCPMKEEEEGFAEACEPAEAAAPSNEGLEVRREKLPRSCGACAVTKLLNVISQHPWHLP